MKNNNDIPCSGTYGSSCNKNNKCTYPECKNMEQTLKDIIKADIRKNERIPTNRFNEFIANTEEPAWVCFDCAKERNASIPEGHIYTVHSDICDICKKEKVEVTEPRDFGLHRSKLRVFSKER